MRETWYMLENGTVADPREVKTREDGRMVHASGALVAVRNGVPHSYGVDPDEERAKTRAALAKAEKEAAAKAASAEAAKPRAAKEVTAEKPQTYKTRETKAR
jgi:hypothetical protein